MMKMSTLSHGLNHISPRTGELVSDQQAGFDDDKLFYLFKQTKNDLELNSSLIKK